jgi:hypothetical protein
MWSGGLQYKIKQVRGDCSIWWLSTMVSGQVKAVASVNLSEHAHVEK